VPAAATAIRRRGDIHDVFVSDRLERRICALRGATQDQEDRSGEHQMQRERHALSDDPSIGHAV
jgi:hypothetical protein